MQKRYSITNATLQMREPQVDTRTVCAGTCQTTASLGLFGDLGVAVANEHNPTPEV